MPDIKTENVIVDHDRHWRGREPTFARVRDLAKDIEEAGYLAEPIEVCREDTIMLLVHGLTRLRAFQRLGWPTIPAVESRSRPEAAVVRLLTSHTVMPPVAPSEKAHAVHQAERDGWSLRDLSKALGSSTEHVRQLVRFGAMHPGVRWMVDAEQLRFSDAIRFYDVPVAEQVEQVEAFLGGGGTGAGVSARRRSLSAVTADRFAQRLSVAASREDDAVLARIAAVVNLISGKPTADGRPRDAASLAEPERSLYIESLPESERQLSLVQHINRVEDLGSGPPTVNTTPR